ncbi:hypothetical protein SLEP1_g1082 [Rubroshorea leprosula]|uniref:Uncharacterized protein n=1 Tax=Rubroshorea leprosula TaxID=152421 RepID=A0AAV5HII3_9ROSI|nr:hypothetical protein SLEP1_g1082 [Rubroshorea leprosula]
MANTCFRMVTDKLLFGGEFQHADDAVKKKPTWTSCC